MSNKNVKVKVRLLALVEEIRDKSDKQARPGTNKSSQQHVILEIPVLQLPADEWAQRIADAGTVLMYGNDVDNDKPPLAITDDPTDITATTAIFHGTVITRSAIQTELRFEFGTHPALVGGDALVIPDEDPISANGQYSAHVHMTPLTPNTKYYYRFRASNANGTKYGIVKSFKTDPSA